MFRVAGRLALLSQVHPAARRHDQPPETRCGVVPRRLGRHGGAAALRHGDADAVVLLRCARVRRRGLAHQPRGCLSHRGEIAPLVNRREVRGVRLGDHRDGAPAGAVARDVERARLRLARVVPERGDFLRSGSQGSRGVRAFRTRKVGLVVALLVHPAPERSPVPSAERAVAVRAARARPGRAQEVRRARCAAPRLPERGVLRGVRGVRGGEVVAVSEDARGDGRDSVRPRVAGDVNRGDARAGELQPPRRRRDVLPRVRARVDDAAVALGVVERERARHGRKRRTRRLGTRLVLHRGRGRPGGDDHRQTLFGVVRAARRELQPGAVQRFGERRRSGSGGVLRRTDAATRVGIVPQTLD
mmetsp:Transcript_7835/g.32733  ORF Transcript_7835/g.32733 Transcript_7835/m.32733 type:complete len:359 (+) Transcript_7835:554-1630(+)